MKKKGAGTIIIWVFVFLSIQLVQSQISKPGLPESFSIRTKQARIIPKKLLDSINTSFLLADDAKYGIKNRYGIVKSVFIDIKKEGISFPHAGKGSIWQYRISSPNALSLGISFQLFLIPEDAKVFIYDETHTHLLGGFTKENNSENGFLAVADLKGNNAIIEYFEPNQPEFEGQLIIGSINQAYREISYTESSVSSARISINCPLGDNWQDEKHAICRMIYQSGQYYYYCTGFLINNTLRDGTPYFMTANHCIGNSTSAETLITYFNYENSTCISSDANTSYTLSGSKLVANSTYSDFSLLILNNTPPVSYQPYYLGWDNTDTQLPGTVCIHHPDGTPKCISSDKDAPITYAYRLKWDDNYISSVNTHWEATFENGSTEGGSSGSPLLNSSKRVIGQLHGGDDISSYFGKFSRSWDYYESALNQLKIWLDPINTGENQIDGLYYTGKPIAQFKCNTQNACISDTIILSDQSYSEPTSWNWTVSPDSYYFINGTDKNSQNPVIAFNKTGLYSISLVTANTIGVDSVKKTNFLSIVDGVAVSLDSLPADSIICGCLLKNYKMSAQGAYNYQYFLERSDKIDTDVVNGNIYLTIKNEAKKAGTFSTRLKVKGSTGSCQSSDSALLKIVLPVNDDIENAITIKPGQYSGISNKCASAETKEPIPPQQDCFSNTGWCPQNKKGINGSLWYQFKGPMNDKISIRTHGSDSRIAVYEADSYKNILSSSSSYSLLAANDDVSAIDKTSYIQNLNVQFGKNYWLQLDGESEEPGIFSFEIWSNSIDILPNLNKGMFDLLVSSEKEGSAEISIITEHGITVKSDKQDITYNQNRIPYNLSYLPSGLYIIKVIINGSVLKSRFVIQRK